MTDPIWWFYLFWLPKFLDARYGVKLARRRGAAHRRSTWSPTSARSVGGWLSGALIKRGWTVNAGRKIDDADRRAAHRADDARAARRRACGSRSRIVSVAAAAHQWWSANLFTTGERHVPAARGGSVVGHRRIRRRDGRRPASSARPGACSRQRTTTTRSSSWSAASRTSSHGQLSTFWCHARAGASSNPSRGT